MQKETLKSSENLIQVDFIHKVSHDITFPASKSFPSGEQKADIFAESVEKIDILDKEDKGKSSSHPSVNYSLSDNVDIIQQKISNLKETVGLLKYYREQLNS